MRRLNRLVLFSALSIAGLTGCDSAPALQSGAQAAEAVGSLPKIAGRIFLDEEDLVLAHRARLLPAATRSLLDEGTMRHGQFIWNDEKVPDGPITIWVDLRRQMISVFREGHEIGTAVMLYGAPDKETPIGTFPVLRKVRDYHSRSYDSPMPYSLFITDDGVALHGSDVRNRRATHGCVGLPDGFASLVFEAAAVGDEVTIVYSDPAIAAQIG